MKRSVAILMTLLSPGVVFLALAICCSFMPQCHTQGACHEEQTAVSGSCCAAFEGGPATATLHNAQFTLFAPEATASPAPVSTLGVVTLRPALTAPLDSSPPVLSLRI